MTLEQCRQMCLSNCSCRAYAAANVSGGGSRGCVIWAVDLLDMRQYTTLVQDVYLRLPQSEIDALNAAAAAGSDSHSFFKKIWHRISFLRFSSSTETIYNPGQFFTHLISTNT
jgi:hypothetical protein